jgi:hypothetical protein
MSHRHDLQQVAPRWAIGSLKSLYGYAAGDLYGACFGTRVPPTSASTRPTDRITTATNQIATVTAASLRKGR